MLAANWCSVVKNRLTLEISLWASLGAAPAPVPDSCDCVGGDDSAGGEGVGVPLTVL